jgi:hypothetical protein
MTRIRFSGCVLSLGDEAPRWAKATIALVGEKVPQLVDLKEPRPLNRFERTVLDFVLDGPNGSPELRAQGASAVVVSACDCGCKSVGLEPTQDTPDADAGNGAYGLTADGTSSTGVDVEVTLHVIFGRLTELEVWDGALLDGESRGELPDVETLVHREPS